MGTSLGAHANIGSAVALALIATSFVLIAIVGVASAKSPFVPVPPIVPRPAGEQVPQPARLLKISWTQPGRHSILITDPSELRQVARILDALPVEGQGTCAEGFIEGPPTIRFSFRATRKGPVLAAASEAARQDFGIAWCVPTTFAVRGRRTLRLEGGSYLLTQAGKILGQKLSLSSKGAKTR